MNLGDLAFWLLLGVFAHAVGDYVLQSDWMALNKSSRWWPAVAHGGAYTAPFVPLILWQDGGLVGWAALAVISGTHAVLDRFRLARFVVWALKGRLLEPSSSRRPWRDCSKTGFPPGTPDWLAWALLTIVDNLIHVAINSAMIVWVVAS